MAGDTEVKAQIRLQFRDITGQKCMAIRSLLASQKVVFLLYTFYCMSHVSCELQAAATLSLSRVVSANYHLHSSSSSRMHIINHNWSATKQRPHPQSVAEISRHSVLSGDRI